MPDASRERTPLTGPVCIRAHRQEGGDTYDCRRDDSFFEARHRPGRATVGPGDCDVAGPKSANILWTDPVASGAHRYGGQGGCEG